MRGVRVRATVRVRSRIGTRDGVRLRDTGWSNGEFASAMAHKARALTVMGERRARGIARNAVELRTETSTAALAKRMKKRPSECSSRSHARWYAVASSSVEFPTDTSGRSLPSSDSKPALRHVVRAWVSAKNTLTLRLHAPLH